MNTLTLTFEVNGQNLINTSDKLCMASDTINYVEAVFALGDGWDGFDSVRAIWTNNRETYATVLDASGKCKAPVELLAVKGPVKVGLVGSITENDILTDRLTTFQAVALNIAKKVPVAGEETSEVTPSQFDQFVAIVQGEVAKVTGMTAEATTLPAGSEATALYSDGVLTFGIPTGPQGEQGPKGDKGDKGDAGETGSQGPKGDKGDTGATGPQGATGETGPKGDTGATPDISIGTVETLAPTEDATATITGTPEQPVLNLGIPKGETGEVSMDDFLKVAVTDEASGSLVTIPDGANLPMKSLKVTLEPIQSGSGTPSPDNVRPISGYDEVSAVVSPTTTASDGQAYTATLPQTVYGGTVDLVSGELVVDRVMVDLGTLNWSEEVDGVYSTRALVGQIKEPFTNTEVPNVLCSQYVSASYIQLWAQQLDGSITVIWSASGAHGRIWVRDSRFTDAAAFKTSMSGVYLVYELATPQTIQLTPQEIRTLLGTNNVWSNGSDTYIKYVADTGLFIIKKIDEALNQ